MFCCLEENVMIRFIRCLFEQAVFSEVIHDINQSNWRILCESVALDKRDRMDSATPYCRGNLRDYLFHSLYDRMGSILLWRRKRAILQKLRSFH